MSMIETKALAIASLLPDEDGTPVTATGDHPFLDWLVKNLGTLLPMLLACLPVAARNPAGLTKALNTPNLRQRAGIRWTIRQNIDDPRTGTRSARDIEDAFHTMGKACTEEDAAALMAESA